jgi:hypothetical protein
MILLVYQAPAAVLVGGSISVNAATAFFVLQCIGYVIVFLPSHPWRLHVKSSIVFSAANTFLDYISSEMWLYADVALSSAISLLGVQRHDFFVGVPTLARLGVVLGLVLLQALPCAIQPGPVLNVRGAIISIAGQLVVGVTGIQLLSEASTNSLNATAVLVWLLLVVSMWYYGACVLMALVVVISASKK